MADFVIARNKIITIRSSDRLCSNDKPSNFTINFSQFNLQPTYCSFHQVALPNGFFNVNANSCAIKVTVTNSSGTPFIVQTSIPTGNYTSSGTNSVITATVNALNAQLVAVNGTAPASFFTGTVNGTNGYFTLSSTTANWTFSISTIGSLEFILGYRASQAINGSIPSIGTSTNQTAGGVVILDLRAPPSIYIRTNLVSGNYLSANGMDSVLCVVQNTALFSQTIFQRSPTQDLDVFPVAGQISQINFQLVDEYGHELNMDTNQDWEISIGLYT